MRLPEILDCTIRDGGYVNQWRFDTSLVRGVYRAASKAGVDWVELGYLSSEKHDDPQKYGLWRFSPASAVAEVTRGIKGAKVSVMIDSGKLDLDVLPPAAESPVDMVRVAAHRGRLDVALEECRQIHERGYLASLQLMGYATYTDTEKGAIKNLVAGAPIEYLYMADSYGSIFPDQIEEFLEPLQGIPGIKVGFHPHNQLHMAFANTLAAMRAGVDMVDATCYGIGRAAGNLPLETLVAYLQFRWPDRFSVLPLLGIIDRYFLRLKQEHPWGYQLPAMMAALLNIHPNYPKALVERREYTIEDIWKGLQAVAAHAGVGFDQKLLDDLVKEGLVVKSNGHTKFAPTPQETATPAKPLPEATYLQRHHGRDFLVLANGPNLKVYADKIKAFIQKHNPVVLGANYLGGLFTPDYHAFSNKRRFKDYIGQVDPSSRLLLSAHFEPEFIAERTDRAFEWLVYQNRLADFGLENGVIASNCRTVSVLLCGVALAMGAARVFVAGMDGYLGLHAPGEHHFYAEADETQDRQVLTERHQESLALLRQIDDYAQEHGAEGLHILTPTDYSEFYKGIENYL